MLMFSPKYHLSLSNIWIFFSRFSIDGQIDANARAQINELKPLCHNGKWNLALHLANYWCNNVSFLYQGSYADVTDYL